MIAVETNCSEAHRKRRIAELLTKAVLLAEAQRGLNPAIAPASGDAASVEIGDHEIRILHYLEVAGRGSPLAIRSALGMSKASAYRALCRLSEKGYVSQTGATRTVMYELDRRAVRPREIDAN